MLTANLSIFLKSFLGKKRLNYKVRCIYLIAVVTFSISTIIQPLIICGNLILINFFHRFKNKRCAHIFSNQSKLTTNQFD